MFDYREASQTNFGISILRCKICHCFWQENRIIRNILSRTQVHVLIYETSQCWSDQEVSCIVAFTISSSNSTI